MRRRQFITATGAIMIGTGLAACSSDPGGNSTAREPTPLSANPAALARFFGSGLTVRSGGSFGLDRAELLPDSDPVLGRLLRVRYPARSASPSVARQYGRPQGGAQVYLELRTGPVDSLHLRYYVRFPNDFDFVKGGKLPGLYGGTVTSGRRIPDGEDGLSTRYMWRAHGAAEVYAYLPTSVAHGTSLGRGSWDWPLGSWVCVEQAVRLNRPGRLDGNVTVHVDGREVLSQNGLEFRTSDRLGIDGVLFSTFFGGSDPSWATPRAQHADFAAFAVSEQPIDPLQGV